MKAGLVHDRADALIALILTVIEYFFNSHGSVFLDEHPSPSASFAHTPLPPTNLTLVIITAPAHEEAAVPSR